eukprot:2826411-Rhodomonas_salina.3
MARLIMETLESCHTFKDTIDAGFDTDEYISKMTTNLDKLKATGKLPTILVALMLQSIGKSSASWNTTAILLADKQDLTLDGARDKLREHYKTFKLNPVTGRTHNTTGVKLPKGVAK